MDTQQLTDELNLKVMVALTGLLQDEARGLITKAEVKTGIRAIFDATSGLVSPESFEILSKASVEYRNAKGITMQAIKEGQHLKGVLRICGHNKNILKFKAVPINVPEYDMHADDADEKARDFANIYFTRESEKGSW